jgi:hypothetical protein
MVKQEPDPEHHNTADETTDPADTAPDPPGDADQEQRGELPDEIPDAE